MVSNSPLSRHLAMWKPSSALDRLLRTHEAASVITSVGRLQGISNDAYELNWAALAVVRLDFSVIIVWLLDHSLHVS